MIDKKKKLMFFRQIFQACFLLIEVFLINLVDVKIFPDKSRLLRHSLLLPEGIFGLFFKKYINLIKSAVVYVLVFLLPKKSSISFK